SHNRLARFTNNTHRQRNSPRPRRLRTTQPAAAFAEESLVAACVRIDDWVALQLLEGSTVSIDEPEVLISEEDISKRVDELAAQISADYSGRVRPLVLVGVLKGSFIFLADLSRRLSIPRTIEFIAVSSYEEGSVHSGAVRLVMDVRGNIEGKHVLIIEDIVDTGQTLHYLIGMLESHRPASV